MVNKNKCKRQYHANKVKKAATSLISSKKAEFNSYIDEYIDERNKNNISFLKTKEEEYDISNKLENVTNNDLGAKIDTISSELSKYIKHSKKFRLIQIVFGIGLGLTSLGLFIYGKIKIDTFMDLLKVGLSTFGLG